MKNPSWLLALPLVHWLGACGGRLSGSAELEVEVESEQPFGISWQAYREQAKIAHFGESYFVAEWDLYFRSEEDLRTHYEQEIVREKAKLAVIRRLSTGFEATYQDVKQTDIIYCVSTSFTNKSTVVSEVSVAAGAWESVGRIRFRYDASQDASCDQNNANVDFAVMPTASGLAGCGANKMVWTLPIEGCPVNGTMVIGVLLMNYGLFPLPPPDHNVTTVGTLRHELGHMLGFRHEHPWAPGGSGCTEAPTYAPPLDLTGRRLTSYDQASVMHYVRCSGVAGTAWDLSPLDGVGAREIYGMPAAWYVPSVLGVD
jgi:hypothetical protein